MDTTQTINYIVQEYLHSSALYKKGDVNDFENKVVRSMLDQPDTALSKFGPILEQSIDEIIQDRINDLLTKNKDKEKILTLPVLIDNLSHNVPDLNEDVLGCLRELKELRNRYSHYHRMNVFDPVETNAWQCVTDMLHFLVWKYECYYSNCPGKLPRSFTDDRVGRGRLMSTDEQPVIETFIATPAEIDYGARATLEWVTHGATRVRIEPESIGTPDDVEPSDSTTIRPNRTQSYTLRAFNADEEMVERTITVNVSQPKNIFIVYDWEDRPEVKNLVHQLSIQGVHIFWDQDWECWSDFDTKIEQAINQSDVIIHYYTGDTKSSEYCEKIVTLARQADKMICSFGDTHPLQSIERTIQKIIDIVNPVRQRYNPPPDNRDVAQLLTEALQENLGIPSDTITDKIFVSPKACQLVELAYEKANAGRDISEEQRIQAFIEYARLKRFQGEWDEADSVLTEISQLCENNKTYCAIHNLEYGALAFERGRINNGIESVKRGMAHFETQGINASLVKSLRQLGNMLVEQGSVEEAQQHLYTAMYLATHIKNEQDIVAELLRIDCVRECASLLMRRNQIDDSLKMLEKELERLEKPDMVAIGEHLKGIILYHIGRAYLAHLRNPRTAENYLRQSLAILEKYDNPVRLAFLYDNIGKAQVDQYPLSNLLTAQSNLEKAMRVRRRCRHRYMIAHSLRGLGDLNRSQHKLPLAIENYHRALGTFMNLNKLREQGNVLFALGLVYAQVDNRSEATNCFVKAEQIFTNLHLDQSVREVEFELLRVKYPGLRAHDLDTILQWARSNNYDIALNEIGEYTLHQWIRKLTAFDHQSHQFFNVEVGIGDDASVVNLGEEGGYSIVLTTDAAPASISRPESLDMAVYAAKFSVVHSLSDILAMGATPTAILLDLYLTRNAKAEYAMKVIETVRNEAGRYGALLIGGDLKERTEQSVGCVGIGVVEKGKAIRRNSAKPGHVVAITLAGIPDDVSARLPGNMNYRKIGLRWAQEILERHGARHDPRYANFFAINWKREFLYLPYHEMIAGANTGLIKSAMDTSDGFLACLQIIGHQSEVGFEINEMMVEEAIDDQVKKIAEDLGYRPAQFLFNAGHDWEIVLTVEERDFIALQNAFKEAGGYLARLGKVCDNHKHEFLREGIILETKDNSQILVPFFTDEKFVRRSSEDRPLEWEDLRFFMEKGRTL